MRIFNFRQIILRISNEYIKQKGCHICGEDTNGLLSMQAFEDGRVILSCKKHSRNIEWNEYYKEQAQEEEKLITNRQQNKLRVMSLLKDAIIDEYYMDDENNLCVILANIIKEE
jgi:hypothetical protein